MEGRKQTNELILLFNAILNKMPFMVLLGLFAISLNNFIFISWQFLFSTTFLNSGCLLSILIRFGMKHALAIEKERH